MKVTALSGGVGGAKLVSGLAKVLNHGELTVIGNTGDDIELFGLHISPDLDIVMYTLAGLVDTEKGWGIRDDTFTCLDSLNRSYSQDRWFNVGDRDLATHILRTQFLRSGLTLSEVTRKLCMLLGIEGINLLPMTDDKVETLVKIQDGSVIHFEEYFVKRGSVDQVHDVVYRGSGKARPAEGVVKALTSSDLVVICPSNPLASIGPILSVRAIRRALQDVKCPRVAVSPIVGGRPIKGPADKFMKGMGFEVSPAGIAEYYHNLVTHLVLDVQDSAIEKQVQSMGIRATVTNTIMNTMRDRVDLASKVISSSAGRS
jgi:LPPG:FO 2-phospho-L-lactate transferase